MNLTWQIVRKDLIYFRLALAIWAISFLYLFLQPNVHLSGTIGLRDFLQLSAILLFTVLSVGVIAGIVQGDHPTDNNAQWRSRPISPGRMVTAKLLLVGFLFVVVPIVAVGVRHAFDQGHALHDASEYGLEGLVLAAVVLSLATAAACTRNVAYALLLWLGVVFGTGTLSDLLSRTLPKLSMQFNLRLNMNRVITLLAFSAVISLAIIVNQYFRRRLSVSIALLIFGSVGSAIVGTLWSYYYFYRG